MGGVSIREIDRGRAFVVFLVDKLHLQVGPDSGNRSLEVASASIGFVVPAVKRPMYPKQFRRGSCWRCWRQLLFGFCIFSGLAVCSGGEFQEDSMCGNVAVPFSLRCQLAPARISARIATWLFRTHFQGHGARRE